MGFCCVKIFNMKFEYIKIIEGMYERYIQFDEDKKMEIYISNTAGEPIYEQIRKQIQQKILAGELREGMPCPASAFWQKSCESA